MSHSDSNNPPGKQGGGGSSTFAGDESGRVDGWGDFWTRIFWRKPAETISEQIRRRINVHLIPVLFCLYILAYLDRSNIGWAKLDMIKSEADGGLALTNEIIGIAIGMFFYGYWILEIPSTLSVLKRGARWVFIRILLLWGICATLMGFIGYDAVMGPMFGWIPKMSESIPILGYATHFLNQLSTNAEYQLYFFRFMLGVFEGGFFPTVIFYLSIWYRQQDRAKSIALFMAAIPLSVAFGSILSQQIRYINLFNLQGWRWIFIIQGVLPIFAAIATLFVMPNRPSEAKWLTPKEREWLDGELKREHGNRPASHGFGALKSQLGMILLLTVVYFGQNVSSYGLSTFVPTFFKELVKSDEDRLNDRKLDELLEPHRKAFAATLAIESPKEKFSPLKINTLYAKTEAYKALEAQRKPFEDALKATDSYRTTWTFGLTTAMYFVAFMGMLINGWHSDRSNERILHVCIPMFAQGCFIALAAYFYYQPTISICFLVFGVGLFHYSHLPAFWPIPTMFLGAAAAASAIGFINMIGNLGGSLGPALVGSSQDLYPQQGMYYLAPAPMIAAAVILGISLLRKTATK